MAISLAKTSSTKIAAQNERRALSKEEAKEIAEAKAQATICKYLPNQLLVAIQVAYSKKCLHCNRLCTFGHLLRDHGLGRHTLTELLIRLQNPKSRRSAKSDLKRIGRALGEMTARQNCLSEPTHYPTYASMYVCLSPGGEANPQSGQIGAPVNLS
jgi:hypothetical protein